MIIKLSFALLILISGLAEASESLKGELSEVFKNRRFGDALIGAEVYSLDTNRELFSLNSTQPMIPASVLKLYTAAAALKELGPEFTFKTEVLAEGSPKLKKGVLKGDLYFKGSGDPSLVDERLDLLVRDVHKSGLRVVAHLMPLWAHSIWITIRSNSVPHRNF
jgi:D-alanyl-D-alanine carboxypeptidase/D-alanyl-D-alanine-endopeptidase (penicillin-binding protein 4)